MNNFLKSKSRTFFLFCFSFLLAIIIISIFDFSFSWLFLLTSIVVLFSLLIIFWKNIFGRFVLLCFLFFIFGLVRYLVTIPQNNNKNLLYYVGNTKVVEGFVSSEPDIRLDGVRYIVSAQFISDKKNNQLAYKKNKVQGNFYFKSTLYPRYEYGDKLRLTCLLKKPEPIEDFQYDKYLARYGVFVDCTPSKIEKIGEGEGNSFLKGIFQVKMVIANKINRLWHEPYASFMAGLLYGYRGGLGTLNDLFSRTGVTHIVAISGYNITIISTILIALCVNLYIPRKKAFWFIVFGIIVFIIFAGASASVVRAGFMGVLVLLTKQIGRKAKISNVMVLTATLMALQNPYILVWDVGFQLSFISTLGLIYIVPIIEKYFAKMPEIFGIKESLITTLGAIIATLPLILYQFNRLSVVSPLVNIFILWILPWIMFAGFFVVVLSFIFLPLAEVLSWLAFIMMKYIVVVVTFFANLSFAVIDLTFSLWMMIIFYLLIIFWVYKHSKTKKI
ncbi:MAG: hypothetical protein ACD_18C00004G0010 [uncultured bacterium]|nr:MAG: hypothetical protein ACD_18C00004G0010 [uncultured bacterium]OGH84800.1 MAG: hypothetical protein A2488_00785 [Candidatus Magasanikbacteria bacterium RIFOXYC12_FULL_32_21b]OGH91813.1 MAG: hypothetical protein A2507_04855 [Candidatus Magasanikbacteria bacterium RIFOXYD12_FULL_33_17]HAO52742.1 hypothetical protein [Candidatus Magasanikbacteria bacterium]